MVLQCMNGASEWEKVHYVGLGTIVHVLSVMSTKKL